MWPVVCLVFGVCMPFWLNYITYTEHNKVEWASRKYAYLFLALNYIFGGILFKMPEMMIGEGRETCLAQTPELEQMREHMINVVAMVMLLGSSSILGLYKLLVQPYGLPHLWLEVKTLQAWINTAFICMFALFTFPFTVLIILIEIIFVAVRPLNNPEKLEFSLYMRELTKGLLWVIVIGGTLSVVLFGTTIDKALNSENAFEYLLLSTREFIGDIIMNYICLGHRLWFFVSFIALPSLITFCKVLMN